MARRRSNPALDSFKADVMRREGYHVTNPDQVKFEVAKSLGIPLNSHDNGQLPTGDAGRIGGQIGGVMVREMVRLAQEKLRNSSEQNPPRHS